MHIKIRLPKLSDKTNFLLAMQSSKSLHLPWINAPISDDAFYSYLKKYELKNNISYLVICDDQIAGVININEIIQGAFLNGYLGYYAVKGFEGRGVMLKGMKLVFETAFSKHGLHRLEANIQPENKSSINLVKRCKFRKEGFSPRYLKILDKWCDHERWAITKEEFI